MPTLKSLFISLSLPISLSISVSMGLSAAALADESVDSVLAETRVVQLAAVERAGFDTLALLSDGGVAVGGGQVDGLLQRLAGLDHVIDFAAGTHSVLFVVDEGEGPRAWRWDYQLDRAPQSLTTLGPVASVTSGRQQLSLLTAAGEIYVWADAREPAQVLAAK